MTASGNDTWAVSVARLTIAVTPSSLFSFFSTRIAHDAQVIPPMTRSVALTGRPRAVQLSLAASADQVSSQASR